MYLGTEEKQLFFTQYFFRFYHILLVFQNGLLYQLNICIAMRVFWMNEESSLQDGVCACAWCMPVCMHVCECLDLVDSSCKRHWMPLFISGTIWAQLAIPTDILCIQSSILLVLQYMDASLKDKIQDGCPQTPI